MQNCLLFVICLLTFWNLYRKRNLNSLDNKNPTSIFLFKVNNGNTRTKYEVCSKVTIKTQERRQSQIFVRKTPALESVLIKLQAWRPAPSQVFSCKICEIFKNTFFEEDLQTTASVTETSLTHFMQLVSFYTT